MPSESGEAYAIKRHTWARKGANRVSQAGWRTTSTEWLWETAIAEGLNLPERSKTVAAVVKRLRDLEKPYRVTNYNDPDRWNRLLDRFEQIVADLVQP